MPWGRANLDTSVVVAKDGRHSSPQLEWTGERYVTSVSGEIEFEHTDRYLFAMPFAESATVLDIASGEVYGSALLGSVARRVIGIDIDENSLAHAKSKYKNDNLSFIRGDCTAIPLSSDSVNLVVSFETLEHILDHMKFFNEICRVLKPDGTLIISTPDKVPYNELTGAPNPYHLKKLDRAEFKLLLNRHFQSVQLLGRSYLEGSVIDPLERGNGEGCEIKGKKRWVRYLEEPLRARRRLVPSTYLIGVASNGSLPKRPPNLLTTASGRQPRWGAIRQARNAEHAMTREVDQVRAALSAAEERQRSLQETVSASGQAAEAMRAEIATLREALGYAEQGAADLQIALGDSEAAARAAEARAKASEDRLAAALVEIDAHNAAAEALRADIELHAATEAELELARHNIAGAGQRQRRDPSTIAALQVNSLRGELEKVERRRRAGEAARLAEITSLRSELAAARDVGRAALASLRAPPAPTLPARRNVGWLRVLLRRFGLPANYPLRSPG
jgi:ubiquinone/menaquinone biosynthesis C-methylase UbiE